VGLLLCLGSPVWAADAEDHGIEGVSDRLAQAGPGNGVYGRFDGNFSFSAGVGARYHGLSQELTPQVRASGRFYQAAGVFVGFCQSTQQSSSLPRMLELGLTLEPLFLLRFSRDAEWGRPFWDLALDSLSLSLGAQLSEPAGGSLGDLSGFSVGLGVGAPLLARAPGPWARLRGTLQTGSPKPQGTIELMLEWQWFGKLFLPAP
jgi:hypothetical protein